MLALSGVLGAQGALALSVYALILHMPLGGAAAVQDLADIGGGFGYGWLLVVVAAACVTAHLLLLARWKRQVHAWTGTGAQFSWARSFLGFAFCRPCTILVARNLTRSSCGTFGSCERGLF